MALAALLALQSSGYVEGAVATLTIRGLDPVTHARLRVEAARHGRSMEAEVRAILQERLVLSPAEHGLGSRIRARFEGLEGDLEVPDRSGELPRAAEFDL
jgi:plasmid stability protein